MPIPAAKIRSYGSHVTDMFSGLHHVQLTIPEGSEAQAREFYGGVLGMVELDKPPVLEARGAAGSVRADGKST